MEISKKQSLRAETKDKKDAKVQKLLDAGFTKKQVEALKELLLTAQSGT